MLKIFLVRVRIDEDYLASALARLPHVPVFVVRAINEEVARENVLEKLRTDPNENRRSWAENFSFKAMEILSPSEEMREIVESL